VNIGNPFSLVPRIIQIEHGSYGVDPEPVDVVAVEPEQGTADQERSDLVAAVVEDVAFPFGMEALLGVGMLEQIGPIEVHQTMLVTGKVRGDPVEDDPEAMTVQFLDQEHEIVRGAVPGGWGEIAGRLITPRTEEGMLHHWQEFHVGEAHLTQVGRELCGQFAVGQRPVLLLRNSSPGPQVELVDGNRRPEGVGLAPGTHPFRVVPGMIEVPDHGSRIRRSLRAERKRVRLVDPVAMVPGDDVVFVDGATAQAGDKTFPNAGTVFPDLQGMGCLVPVVEVAHDGNLLGVGSPQGEMSSGDAPDTDKVSPHLFEEGKVAAFLEEIDVVVGEKGSFI